MLNKEEMNILADELLYRIDVYREFEDNERADVLEGIIEKLVKDAEAGASKDE